MEANKTFVEAVEAFFKSATWLTEDEKPAMTGLMKAAEALDEKFMGNTLAEYGKIHRYLMKLKPSGEEEKDEMEDDLNDTGLDAVDVHTNADW